MEKVKIYIKSIFIPVILGGVIEIIIGPFIDYNLLEKPFLSPPSIVFPIVWTILYILMGLSYGILKSKQLTDFEIDKIYYIQLMVYILFCSKMEIIFICMDYNSYCSYYLHDIEVL